LARASLGRVDPSFRGGGGIGGGAFSNGGAARAPSLGSRTAGVRTGRDRGAVRMARSRLPRRRVARRSWTAGRRRRDRRLFRAADRRPRPRPRSLLAGGADSGGGKADASLGKRSACLRPARVE